MALREMFFVQVFDLDRKNRLIGGQSYSLPSAEEAKLKAARVAEKSVGCVAFSQLVDDKADYSEEPVLLAYYGRVPEEARATAA